MTAALKSPAKEKIPAFTRVLKALQAAPDKPISGAALAQKGGVSRAAVHKQVAQLRKLGYGVVGTPRVGYRLDPHVDFFDAAAVRNPWKTPVHFQFSTESTQNDAKRAALDGAKEGALFIADRQTGGRGRLGRPWQSPPGGLWYSLVLQPTLPPTQTPPLALLAGLSWVQILRRDHQVDAQVKWPNDVWVKGRKLAGILTEMSAEFGRVHWAVMGVGVNVNNAAPRGTEPAAVSLKAIVGKSLRRDALLSAWLAHFAAHYARYLTDGFAVFQRVYEDHLLFRGQEVRFQTGGRTHAGRLLGVNASGQIVLESAAGPQSFQEGEIAILKP